ncbi:hypothetical protein JCM21900_005054 [Sporobolomyces salmonicolor]
MNAHHKKSSYCPPPPCAILHASTGAVDLPLDSKNREKTTAGCQLWRTVERIPFGWQLDAVIPSIGTSGSSALAAELEQFMAQSCGFQACERVNLADLLEPEFMNSFVRKGSLVALSLDKDEGADIVALDGRGRLILSVSKDTYEVLGLPGRASAYGSLRQRFVIEISLVDPAFCSGKTGFERVKRLLRDWPRETNIFEEMTGAGQAAKKGGKTFDLLMSYVDDGGQPQPITFPSGVSSHPCSPCISKHTLSRIAIPSSSAFPFSSSSSPSKCPRTSSGPSRRSIEESDQMWEEVKEWVGLAQIGVEDKLSWKEGDGAEEDGCGVDREACEEGEATMLSWNALLHPKAMSAVLETVLNSASLTLHPFLHLSLRPVPHSPISHTSKSNPPIVGTSKRPNGKKRKRGRGRGEEEEAERERVEKGGGWEVVLKPNGQEKGAKWWMWEGQ